ncbi:MerR family transcriptional regulator [Bacillus sp. WMMC1349]|uniref:MerR family transcriptional regulator n=1 Tax=Bacillus sp. WMMC1349 TaxID=2736254 RepID=UPI00155746DD|nr:MerR family transcriptional regulator [Bacillus sp. WMMC1349]NPC91308.1 MerR family transcriptional regulator [Bacillus sp. WMMC1349]
MNEKLYTVKTFARLTGVTERTLHYYDQKGVLVPTNFNDKGHRLYSCEDIFKMQKILTLKYLGFSLKEIIEYNSKITTNSVHDTLDKQKELLKKQRDEIDHVICTISRVEQMIKNEEVESDLLLAIIHSIQNEKNQEDWLSNQVCKSIVEQAFMQHIPKEERIAIERDLLTNINKLQSLYKNGYSSYAAEVQNIIKQLVECINKIIEPKYQEEIEKLEIEEDSLYHFSFMSKGVQDFIGDAMKRFHG